MAEHHQVQNAKQANDAAHPRRTIPPVQQSPVELTLQAARVVSVQRAIADPRAASPRDILTPNPSPVGNIEKRKVNCTSDELS
jgi:hypothetical protein